MERIEASTTIRQIKIFGLKHGTTERIVIPTPYD